MSRFVFPTNEASEAYCLEIADAMMLFFGITEENAITRINEQWKHMSILGDNSIIYHESPDHWAKWIFFGGNSYWKNADVAPLYSLARLERRVNLILDHLGIEYKDVSAHVKYQVSLGHRTQATKLLQYETGLDFRECFDIVKRLEAEIKLQEQTHEV